MFAYDFSLVILANNERGEKLSKINNINIYDLLLQAITILINPFNMQNKRLRENLNLKCH